MNNITLMSIIGDKFNIPNNSNFKKIAAYIFYKRLRNNNVSIDALLSRFNKDNEVENAINREIIFNLYEFVSTYNDNIICVALPYKTKYNGSLINDTFDLISTNTENEHSIYIINFSPYAIFNTKQLDNIFNICGNVFRMEFNKELSNIKILNVLNKNILII